MTTKLRSPNWLNVPCPISLAFGFQKTAKLERLLLSLGFKGFIKMCCLSPDLEGSEFQDWHVMSEGNGQGAVERE